MKIDLEAFKKLVSEVAAIDGQEARDAHIRSVVGDKAHSYIYLVNDALNGGVYDSIEEAWEDLNVTKIDTDCYETFKRLVGEASAIEGEQARIDHVIAAIDPDDWTMDLDDYVTSVVDAARGEFTIDECWESIGN